MPVREVVPSSLRKFEYSVIGKASRQLKNPLTLAWNFLRLVFTAFRCAFTHLKLLHLAGHLVDAFAVPAVLTTANAAITSVTMMNRRISALPMSNPVEPADRRRSVADDSDSVGAEVKNGCPNTYRRRGGRIAFRGGDEVVPPPVRRPSGVRARWSSSLPWKCLAVATQVQERSRPVWLQAGVVCDLGRERMLQLVPLRPLQQFGLSLAAELEPQVAIDVKTHCVFTSFPKRKAGCVIRHAAASPSGIG